MRRSLYLVLGCVKSLLHVWLFLERDRARKMRQLSINHLDARIPSASFACRCVAKTSFHLFVLSEKCSFLECDSSPSRIIVLVKTHRKLLYKNRKKSKWEKRGKSGQKSCKRLNEKGAKILWCVLCVALSRSVPCKAE